MDERRAWTAVLVAAAVIGAMTAGCGIGTGSDPTAGCTDEERTAGEPGDAEPLLTLGSARLGPTIVYADGAVVVPTAVVGDDAADAAGAVRVPTMMPGYTGDQPGGFQAGWLSGCELDAVTEIADDLLTGGTDFGDPQVTDSGSTSVSYDGNEESIYAFSRHDPAEWGDLTTSQREARQDLADLWDLVEDSAELTGGLEIDRLFVETYGPIDDAEVTDWPLTTPVSALQGCTTVTDPAEVEALLERLEDEPLLEDTAWRMSVVAAAPGVPDCEG